MAVVKDDWVNGDTVDASDLNAHATQTNTNTTDIATKQASDADLTAIAGLSPSNDDIIQRKAGAWTNRTVAQVKTDLTLVKGDVGLGNVDNTSNVTERAAAATLQNKTFDNTNTATIKDANLTIQDDGDATKQAKFQASGISAGQTRVLTIPDASTTLVGNDTAQTLTAKTVALGSNTVSGSLAEFNTALTGADFATLAGTETLTGKTIDGDDNTIQDLPVSALKANALVTAAEGLASSDNDTSLPTTAAVIDGLDTKQPLDTDLTTIAGLTATTDNFMVAASSAWASRTPAQAKTSLALVKGDVGLGNVTNNAQYFPGGTDVAVADGGTGASTAAGALTNLQIPADFMLVQVGNIARAVGSGDFAVAHRVGRAFTATSVIYQFDTADASGNTGVELRRNGSQVTSSNLTVSAANQVDGTGTDAARTATISQSFAAGDRIHLQITSVGTTPGKGLRAWIVGTWN